MVQAGAARRAALWGLLLASAPRGAAEGSEPEPAGPALVEVEEETSVMARPSVRAPLLGTLARGARVPVRGAALVEEDTRYCPGRRWLAIAPSGWLCAARGRPAQGGPTEAAGGVAPGERLPYRYATVTRELPLWRDAAALRAGLPPARTLERGDSVALRGALEHGGEAYLLTADEQVLPLRGTAPLREPSAWQGAALAGPVAPFGWTGPSGARLYAAPGRPARPAAALPPRQRVPILAEVGAGGDRYLQVRPGAWVRAAEVGEVRPQPPPAPLPPDGRWIDVDLGEQVLVAYEGARPVYATLISSGRGWSTPLGDYPVWAKARAVTMKNQPGEDATYYVDKVPWVLFFQGHNALHAAYWHDGFGAPRSHGCINLAPADARRLFEWAGPEVPPGWTGVQVQDPRASVLVHVRDSRRRTPFRQDRPPGPPWVEGGWRPRGSLWSDRR